MDLEATSEELQTASDNAPATPAALMTEEDLQLEDLIAAGTKNLEWIKYLSENQPEGSPPLSLSVAQKPKDSMKTPIRYGPKTILAEFEELKKIMPPAMKEVLFSGAKLTSQFPVEKSLFLERAGKLDVIYQRAIRWKLYKPYLEELKSRQVLDIRGYHFLKDRPQLTQELVGWKTLTSETQSELKEWLLNICYNSLGSVKGCLQRFNERLAENQMIELYNEYYAYSGMLYRRFFDISETRAEFIWNSKNPNKMITPFQKPSDLKVEEALRINIQDEWRWQDWKLEIQFTSDAPVRVMFEEGATPSVNQSRDTILMDANAPLTEESVKYALRHEFGHILGFPDCYLEFYDDIAQVIVGYQIDPTDIMCSQSGKVKQRHFEALKSEYYKN